MFFLYLYFSKCADIYTILYEALPQSKRLHAIKTTAKKVFNSKIN